MSEKSGKSRRRFLADLLFLGGGVTAASLLAKSTLLSEPQPQPQPDPIVKPDKPKNPPEVPQTRGEAVVPDGDYEPQIDGDFVVPEEQPVKEECPPQVKGKVKLPEPNPAGGMLAPPPSNG